LAAVGADTLRGTSEVRRRINGFRKRLPRPI
jgi:hypothetical protein